MPTKVELQAEIDRLKKKLAEYQPEYATEDAVVWTTKGGAVFVCVGQDWYDDKGRKVSNTSHKEALNAAQRRWEFERGCE
jgi:hypothetical protein